LGALLFFLVFLSINFVGSMATSKYGEKDPDGFDRQADTVGAGIYSGNVKRDKQGNVIWGKQYQNHNPNPGPVYNGDGYSEISKAIHTGKPDIVLQMILKNPKVVNEISTGGATPLHTCGMSRRGQLVTQVLVDNGANINAVDTYGYTPLHRMASNNLSIGAEVLLKAGAPVDQTTGKPYSGETAISIARSSGAFDVVKVLKKYQ
jgi:hypothetical protein